MKGILLIGLFSGVSFAAPVVLSPSISKQSVMQKIEKEAKNIASDAVKAGAWLADVASEEFKAGYDIAIAQAQKADIAARQLAAKATACKGVAKIEAQKAAATAKVQYQKALEILKKYEDSLSRTQLSKDYYDFKTRLDADLAL